MDISLDFKGKSVQRQICVLLVSCIWYHMLGITYKVTGVEFRAFETCMSGVPALLFTKVLTAKENVRNLEICVKLAQALQVQTLVRNTYQGKM